MVIIDTEFKIWIVITIISIIFVSSLFASTYSNSALQVNGNSTNGFKATNISCNETYKDAQICYYDGGMDGFELNDKIYINRKQSKDAFFERPTLEHEYCHFYLSKNNLSHYDTLIDRTAEEFKCTMVFIDYTK